MKLPNLSKGTILYISTGWQSDKIKETGLSNSSIPLLDRWRLPNHSTPYRFYPWDTCYDGQGGYFPCIKWLDGTITPIG